MRVVSGMMIAAALAGSACAAENDTVMADDNARVTTYTSATAVKAFAPTPGCLWYANDAEVVQLGLKKKEMQTYQKLGTLPGNSVTCMAADGSGNVWVGTPEGLAVRIGKDWKVFTTDNGLVDNNVTCISVPKLGGVWVGTGAGVCAQQGSSWKSYTTKDGLVSNEVQCILVDTKGRTWVGAPKGISCLEGTRWTSHTMKNGLSWNSCRALGYDAKTNTLWAAVGESDVNSNNGSGWHVYMSVQAGITGIATDSYSRVWFGSETGIVKFNGEEWITGPQKIGIPMNQVSQMYCDPQGNLWFGGDTGVLMYGNPYAR